MIACMICHFVVELDDIVVRAGATSCVCLRCYARETDSARPMPKPLRRALIAALAGLGD